MREREAGAGDCDRRTTSAAAGEEASDSQTLVCEVAFHGTEISFATITHATRIPPSAFLCLSSG